MKHQIILIGLALLLLLSGCQSNGPLPKEQSNSFILKNVNIVDVASRSILENRKIVVRDGKIVRVLLNSTDVNSGIVRVIDGEGRFVTPGLIDMHVHMYEREAFAFSLSHGVTHVRIMNGFDSLLEWRDRIENGDLIGSTASVSSPILSSFDSIHHVQVLNAQQGADAVKRFHEKGYDLIKAYGYLSADALMGIVEQARALGIPVAKHGPAVPKGLELSKFTDFQSLEHAEDIFQMALKHEFDLELLDKSVNEIAQLRVPITPTLNIYQQLTRLSVEKEAYLAQVPIDYSPSIVAYVEKDDQVARWLGVNEKHAQHNQRVLNFLKTITSKLHEAGVPLLVGSDSGVLLSGHGLATHKELALLSESGLDGFDVLRAATINPAVALGLDNEIGQVAQGLYADFVLSSSNPIDDLGVLRNPDAVVKRGVVHDRQQLEKMREHAIASRSIWSELSVIAEMALR